MIIHNPILTGSFTVNGTDVSSITSSAASLTSLNSYTASQNNRNGTYATTGSNTFAGIQTVNSNLVVTGSITAQTLVVQTVTSSVVYSSGSNVFGNNIANTQVFTGSMNLTGSLTVVTTGTEFQVNSTGVNLGNALTDSHIISGSITMNPGGLFVSSSGNVGFGTTTPGYTATNRKVVAINGGSSAAQGSILAFMQAGVNKGYVFSIQDDMEVWCESGQVRIGNNANASVVIKTQNTDRLTISGTGAATFSANDATGNRTNPFNTLTITTDNPNIPYGFFGGSILFRNRSYTSGLVDSARIRSVIYDDGAPNNFGGGLWFETTPTPGGTLTPSLVINYQGRVGIGTTSPTQALSVYRGGASNYLRIQGDNNSGYDIAQEFTDGTNAVYSGMMRGSTGLTGAYTIFTGGAARINVISAGSVGVGVIPKTYASTWAGFQVGNFSLMGPNPSTDQNAILGANVYRATDNTWKRIIAGYGNLIEFNQGSGDIRTYTGGTSTADSTVSFVSGPFLSNGGVSWTNGSSDIRKKKNFETSQGLAEILQIEPVKYHFNWDEDNAKKRLGFKAQNLQNLIPEMVSETGEIAEDGSNYLTITPDYILPVLVKAIQELKAEIEILKNK